MSANVLNVAYIIVVTRFPTTANTIVIAVDQCARNALAASISHGLGTDIVKVAVMECTMVE